MPFHTQLGPGKTMQGLFAGQALPWSRLVAGMPVEEHLAVPRPAGPAACWVPAPLG